MHCFHFILKTVSLFTTGPYVMDAVTDAVVEPNAELFLIFVDSNLIIETFTVLKSYKIRVSAPA